MLKLCFPIFSILLPDSVSPCIRHRASDSETMIPAEWPFAILMSPLFSASPSLSPLLFACAMYLTFPSQDSIFHCRLNLKFNISLTDPQGRRSLFCSRCNIFVRLWVNRITLWSKITFCWHTGCPHFFTCFNIILRILSSLRSWSFIPIVDMRTHAAHAAAATRSLRFECLLN
jgi:hypothetical protein